MKACCTCMTNKAEKEIGRGIYKQVSNTITNKKHLDASVKERPQTLLVPSEQICKRVLCNKHI